VEAIKKFQGVDNFVSEIPYPRDELPYTGLLDAGTNKQRAINESFKIMMKLFRYAEENLDLDLVVHQVQANDPLFMPFYEKLKKSFELIPKKGLLAETIAPKLQKIETFLERMKPQN
jgi:7,8-dihydro-6-hydroxymethylpterin-pyrophosphokinase